ncbi:unnamed protein product [Arabidopsis halleri]
MMLMNFKCTGTTLVAQTYIVDERLDGLYNCTELICCDKIAIMCLQDGYNNKPTISEIVHIYVG